MNFPVEIVAAVLGIALAAMMAERRAMWKRIGRIEKRLLVLIVMLNDRGFRIPDKDDTDIFLKSNRLDI